MGMRIQIVIGLEGYFGRGIIAKKPWEFQKSHVLKKMRYREIFSHKT